MDIQLSCSGRRRFFIIGVILLLVTSAWSLRASCDDERLIQPVKVDDHFEKSGVEFQVYLFVEPFRELESSSLQISCGIASVPAELWKLEVHVPRELDFPVEFEPEEHIRNTVLLSGNKSYETSKPSVFYWILGVEASSGTAGKKVMANYNLTINLFYANMSEVEFSLITDPKSVHILPGESTFPSEILHPLLASIGLAFILPLASYFINTKRRKAIRRKIIVGSITLLLAGILFNTSVSAVDNNQGPKTAFLASYQVIVLADVYQNDTYIPVSSSRTYVWLEEKLNSTSAILGEVRLAAPLQFTFKEVNFDQLKSNSSDGWIPWWVPPTISSGDVVKVLNHSLIASGHDDYFALSALRKTIKLSYEDEEVSVKAQYDAASGFLFRLMIEDQQTETFDLYLFQSILGAKLSIAWTYYTIFFLTMVATPTLLTLSLTWPKTRRRKST